MMERRRALTIPFSVERDNLMENPLKIPLTCLSSECGKLERQVSWTSIADYKLRQSDSQHKNGSTLFDHNHVAKIPLEMARRKPTLVLTDVLKTEMGKIYIERIKKCNTLRNRGQVTSTRRESGRCREEPQTCRETRSSQREAANDKNKSVTPKRNRRTSPSTFQRSRLRKRLHCVDDKDDKEENKDIKEMIIGNDNGADHKFPEVVDCGLSVSWKPAKDSSDCDEFSPASPKDRCTDLGKVQHNLRKRKDSGSQLNGTGSPKRHCESLLCLTGEDERDEGSPSHICLEKSGEDGDLNLDRSIVQFTVGLDDTTEVAVPAIDQNLESEDFNSNPRLSLLSAQDISNTSPTDPIVLSSDDEETCDVPDDHSPAVHTLVTLDNPVIDGLSLQDDVAKESEASDMEVLHVFVDDLPDSVIISPLSNPSVDYTCMGIAFSILYCGTYQGKANGDIMMADQKIIIPLKDPSEQKEVILTLQRKELRRYSVWDQEEMEAQELRFKGDLEPCPAAVLLLCVSETAAAAIQQDLCKLCNEPKEKQETINTGKASPFILLTLKDPLEGMEGALLRSLLDIDCLNGLTEEQSIITHDADRVTSMDDLHTPPLSLDVNIELIRRIGLDSHLLSLLGLQTSDSGFYADQDFPHFDRDETILPCVQLEAEPHTETVLGLVTESEQEERTQQNPEEDQEEEELEHPFETKEPTPLYTLCHQRTKGSYSVSLCKPSSNWTQYNHRALTQRLIQFPPPPVKGGITVTVEDLQCLDSGQFLNDVIIDFYLKYLLENASAAVAERTHIFSSFFYKQLTRRDNASEGTTSDSCQRQRRHQRVRTWTRHVDIFDKDFLFVPVNQEAHWYLVVICFPGMEEAKIEAWNGPDSPGGTGELEADDEACGSKSPNFDAEVPSPLNHSDNLDTETESSQEESNKEPPPGPVNCTKWTCQKNIICKRPCILIMDSLKLSLHERVFKLLREYLQSEWECRRTSSRDFGPDQMKSSHCQVPLQDNSSDCGLYLLQYVESFLKDPVVHFDLPLNLKQWFPRQKVRRKRDEIRDLVLHLYRHQNLEDNEQRCSAVQCNKIL
ncbi:sentrin-specific protease 7 [Mastacembelus armatus]|uniref:Si:dkey-100n23.3 n=1 Tax=Mastacembelus armatus TaxID=205130 RepID=A0A3Q3MSM4_9TELE|nr:sentrin-specific protease 7 [Mastacembelus armatus]